MFGPRSPDLLAVDDKFIALANRRGAQAQGVGAAGRLGHAEGLEADIAAGDLRQPFGFLFNAAVAQQRAHGVHLGVAGRAVAPAFVDFIEDRRRRVDAEPGAAVFLGDQHGEETVVGQRLDEFAGIGPLAVQLAPVFAGKIGAQRAHGVANGLDFGVRGLRGLG
jgi:hypothetical protein